MSEYPDAAWRSAVTDALTSLRAELPLNVTLVLHGDPVLTGNAIAWQLPLGRVTADPGGVIEFLPEPGR